MITAPEQTLDAAPDAKLPRQPGQYKKNGMPWYWIWQLLGWLLVGAFNTYPSVLNQPADTGKFLLIYSWSSVTGLWLTHRWRRHLQASGWLDHRRSLPWLKLTLGVVVLAVAQVILVAAVFYALRPANSFHNWQWLPMALAGWTFIFGMWTVLYTSVHARRRFVQAELDKLRLEISIKDAELRALQAQVNPHFFFNSLNSIRALIYQDTELAAQAVEQLADMMRYSLQTGQNKTVHLAQEMEAVRNYLAIEKIRFEDRLLFAEDVPDALQHLAIPPMTVQTLVENAVKYGVETSAGSCEIRIGAQLLGNRLQLTVANQGSLVRRHGSTQLGLNNVSKRLGLLFGAQASATITENGGWVYATLTLPLEPA
ncbi:sensor histidine kinase [Undibacterium terreum]|uniref:Histidine kinase n=1 Tax=Undibacterium terreum TaxID=1224302 RepID=A0A916UZ36_9BURK|nr:sensor histidine kinase [Undibacterium terreum]GGC95928.1 histidine kinase [Undibacterium terreum]